MGVRSGSVTCEFIRCACMLRKRRGAGSPSPLCVPCLCAAAMSGHLECREGGRGFASVGVMIGSQRWSVRALRAARALGMGASGEASRVGPLRLGACQVTRELSTLAVVARSRVRRMPVPAVSSRWTAACMHVQLSHAHVCP